MKRKKRSWWLTHIMSSSRKPTSKAGIFIFNLLLNSFLLFFFNSKQEVTLINYYSTENISTQDPIQFTSAPPVRVPHPPVDSILTGIHT